MPRFTVAFRGYDRVQVDAYVRSLLQGGEASPQDGTPPAPPRDGEPSGLDAELAAFFKDSPLRVFDVVFRGYDRKEVERFIGEQERRRG